MTRDEHHIGEPAYYHTRITEWPEDERPREKMLAGGPAALSDAELLAIILRSGSGKVTAVDLGKALLREFESVGRLSSRTARELTRFRGIGPAKAAGLVAAFELGRRSAAARGGARLLIRSPEDVVGAFAPLLRDLKHEVFKVILLDSANHRLRDVDVSTGILNSSLAHPREVFSPAIVEPAAGVILLHNHPSGNPEPSSEDLRITRQLVEAGKILGIPVHDHIIVAGEAYTSFAERGIL